MKLILTILIATSSVWALDYDPQFHNKHRYNRHKDIQQKMESSHQAAASAQKMEASETSKEPLKTTPNVRMIDHEKQE